MPQHLVMRVYELLTVLSPFFIVYAVSDGIDRRAGAKPNPRGFFWAACAFAVYIFAAFFFTHAGTLYDLLRYGKQIHSGQYNFIPFSNDIDVIAYILNVLLFVPLGVFLPLLWPRMDNFKCAALSGLSFSFLIELSQIFNHRATDIDDLFMNTAGALLGYLLFKWSKPWRGLRGFTRAGPFVYIAAMFAGHFLLYDMFVFGVFNAVRVR